MGFSYGSPLISFQFIEDEDDQVADTNVKSSWPLHLRNAGSGHNTPNLGYLQQVWYAPLYRHYCLLAQEHFYLGGVVRACSTSSAQRMTLGMLLWGWWHLSGAGESCSTAPPRA